MHVLFLFVALCVACCVLCVVYVVCCVCCVLCVVCCVCCVKAEFDCRPSAIAVSLALREPKYQESAAYCHFGREPVTKKIS